MKIKDLIKRLSILEEKSGVLERIFNMVLRETSPKELVKIIFTPENLKAISEGMTEAAIRSAKK